MLNPARAKGSEAMEESAIGQDIRQANEDVRSLQDVARALFRVPVFFSHRNLLTLGPRVPPAVARSTSPYGWTRASHGARLRVPWRAGRPRPGRTASPATRASRRDRRAREMTYARLHWRRPLTPPPRWPSALHPTARTAGALDLLRKPLASSCYDVDGQSCTLTVAGRQLVQVMVPLTVTTNSSALVSGVNTGSNPA